MKQNKQKLMFILTLLGGMLFYGCAKDGAIGPKGDKGADGTNGTNGTNGNANVNGATVTVSANQWAFDNGTYYTVAMYSPITQEIIDKGAVLVYYGDDGSSWDQLPFTYYINSQSSYNFRANHSVGQVTIALTYSDFSQANLPVLMFKIVVISASQKLEYPNLNWSNYQEVKAAFKLVD